MNSDDDNKRLVRATPWEICDVAIRLAQLRGDCVPNLHDGADFLARAESISRGIVPIPGLSDSIALAVNNLKSGIPETLVEMIAKAEPSTELLSKGMTRQKALALIIRQKGMGHEDRESYFRRAYFQCSHPNEKLSKRKVNAWWDAQVKIWGRPMGSKSFDASGFQTIATVDEFWRLAELVAPHVPAWKEFFAVVPARPRKRPRSREAGTIGQFVKPKQDPKTGRFKGR